MIEGFLVDKQTEGWIEAAQRNERPFGAAVVDTLALISVVEEVNGSIAPLICQEGRLRWRAVNGEPRTRRFVLRINTTHHRIEKNKADLLDVREGVCLAKITVPAYDATFHTTFPWDEHTVRFVVRTDGAETVSTECNSSKDFRVSSKFDTRLGGESKMPKFLDYLAAALSALKSVPVLGAAIAEPVLRLYDQARRDEFNKGIATVVDAGNAMTREALAQILDLKRILGPVQGESGEELMALEFLTYGVNAVAGRGEIPSTLAVSEWPFPFSEETLLRELDFLFLDNLAPLRTCLTRNGWRVGEWQAPDQVIHQFVKDLKGRASKAAPLLECMVAEKPDSTVLAVALSYCAH
jgi:hypothetical protein